MVLPIAIVVMECMLLQHMHIGLKYMGPLQCTFGVPSTLLVWDFFGLFKRIKSGSRPRTSLITSIMGWSILDSHKEIFIVQKIPTQFPLPGNWSACKSVYLCKHELIATPSMNLCAGSPAWIFHPTCYAPNQWSGKCC